LPKSGNIPAVKIGHKWRFDSDEIDRWLHPELKGAKLRILVIEDDEIIGQLFKETVREMGHTILGTSTSAEGLEYVE